MWMESKGSFTVNSNRCAGVGGGGINQQRENRGTISLVAFLTSGLLFYIFCSSLGFKGGELPWAGERAVL